MPRKSTSRTPAAAPRKSPSQVTGRDLEVAKRDALLQLRLGRSGHVVAVFVSALLVADALLLLFAFPHLPSVPSSSSGWSIVWPTSYLLLPLVGAISIAVTAIAAKWREFPFWPWEGHLAATVGSAGLALAAAVLYGTRLEGQLELLGSGLFPLVLTLSLSSISLALVGLALTWSPWDRRHWTSAVCALLPLASSVLLFLPTNGASGGSEALAVALLVAAVLYQTSGSFLHLLSSGTEGHREAVVLSGQDRVGRLAEEVRLKEEALRFRELALVQRESDADTAESTAHRTQAAIEASTQRLQALDSELRARTERLGSRERDTAGRSAELDGRERLVRDREESIGRESDRLRREAASVDERSAVLTHDAGQLAQREAELDRRESEVGRRESTLPEMESRLATREKQVEAKTVDLLRREGDVTARERSLPSTGKGATGPSAGEQDLAAREARARHLKGLLDEQSAVLAQRAQEVAAQARQADTGLRQLADRHAMIASREATLAQKEGDLNARLRATEALRSELDASVKEYRGRLEDAAKGQAELARLRVDVDRSAQTIPTRERALSDRETRLSATASELDRREAQLLARERTLDTRETQVGLRRLEAGAGPPGDAPARGSSGFRIAADLPRATRPAVANGPSADGPSLVSTENEAAGAAATLSAPARRRFDDRISTGTPRLDDLLLGGLPPKSHIALVGEPFVGKEVALYAFVAEGLKRGEPALLVTASRTPEEVAQSLGVLLPQFREFEQRGEVTWVDASGTGTAPGPHRMVTNGSNDLDGILAAVTRIGKELGARAGRFRVGFLGLSTAVAHGEERAGYAFVQSVVGNLKPREALAMYTVEAAALSEAQAESILARLDGAIVFRQDRDRTYLSVKGLGDVATRDWVECRASNRALIVGSFALERIR